MTDHEHAPRGDHSVRRPLLALHGRNLPAGWILNIPVENPYVGYSLLPYGNYPPTIHSLASQHPPSNGAPASGTK